MAYNFFWDYWITYTYLVGNMSSRCLNGLHFHGPFNGWGCHHSSAAVGLYLVHACHRFVLRRPLVEPLPQVGSTNPTSPQVVAGLLFSIHFCTALKGQSTAFSRSICCANVVDDLDFFKNFSTTSRKGSTSALRKSWSKKASGHWQGVQQGCFLKHWKKTFPWSWSISNPWQFWPYCLYGKGICNTEVTLFPTKKRWNEAEIWLERHNNAWV